MHIYIIYEYIEGLQAKVHNSTFCRKWVFDIKINALCDFTIVRCTCRA